MEREGIRTQGILEQIVQTGESVILTNVSEGVATPGILKGTVLEEVDIVSPLGADIWDVRTLW